MKLAVRYMGLVALLAMAPLAWASEPTDGERFRLRLHSTERYAIPGVGGGTMVRVEAPFLCITDAGARTSELFQPTTTRRPSCNPVKQQQATVPNWASPWKTWTDTEACC
jgi:hypothetical protein